MCVRASSSSANAQDAFCAIKGTDCRLHTCLTAKATGRGRTPGTVSTALAWWHLARETSTVGRRRHAIVVSMTIPASRRRKPPIVRDERRGCPLLLKTGAILGNRRPEQTYSLRVAKQLIEILKLMKVLQLLDLLPRRIPRLHHLLFFTGREGIVECTGVGRGSDEKVGKGLTEDRRDRIAAFFFRFRVRQPPSFVWQLGFCGKAVPVVTEVSIDRTLDAFEVSR